MKPTLDRVADAKKRSNKDWVSNFIENEGPEFAAIAIMAVFALGLYRAEVHKEHWWAKMDKIISPAVEKFMNPDTAEGKTALQRLESVESIKDIQDAERQAIVDSGDLLHAHPIDPVPIAANYVLNRRCYLTTNSEIVEKAVNFTNDTTVFENAGIQKSDFETAKRSMPSSELVTPNDVWNRLQAGLIVDGS